LWKVVRDRPDPALTSIPDTTWLTKLTHLNE
jgi:hypothetical protein